MGCHDDLSPKVLHHRRHDLRRHVALHPGMQVSLRFVEQEDDRSLSLLLTIALERSIECYQVYESCTGGRKFEVAIIVSKRDTQRIHAIRLLAGRSSHNGRAQCIAQECVESVERVAFQPGYEVSHDMALIARTEHSIDNDASTK